MVFFRFNKVIELFIQLLDLILLFREAVLQLGHPCLQVVGALHSCLHPVEKLNLLLDITLEDYFAESLYDTLNVSAKDYR